MPKITCLYWTQADSVEVEVNANIILRAREIRNHYHKAPGADGTGLKMMDLGDFIHLATASILGADEFHTRDKDRRGSKITAFQSICIKLTTKLGSAGNTTSRSSRRNSSRSVGTRPKELAPNQVRRITEESAF